MFSRNKRCIAIFFILPLLLLIYVTCYYTWWEGHRNLCKPDLLVARRNIVNSSEVGPIFIPISNRLMFGGQNCKLIHLDNESLLFLSDSSEICSLSLRRKSKEIITVTQNGIVQLWDLDTGTEHRRFSLEGVDVVGWAGLSPDEETLVTTGKGLDELIAWNLDTGRR